MVACSVARARRPDRAPRLVTDDRVVSRSHRRFSWCRCCLNGLLRALTSRLWRSTNPGSRWSSLPDNRSTGPRPCRRSTSPSAPHRSPWTWSRSAVRVQLVSVVNVMSKTGPAPATALARRLGLAPAADRGHGPSAGTLRSGSSIAPPRPSRPGTSTSRSCRRGGAALGQSASRRTDRWIGASRRPRRAGRGARPRPGGRRRPRRGRQRRAAVGLVAPVHVYALFESVIGPPAGRSAPEQRDAWAS